MLKAAATGAPALLRQAWRGVSSLPIDQNPGQWSVSIKMLEINNFRVCPWSRLPEGGKGVEREKDFSRRTIFTGGQRRGEAANETFLSIHTLVYFQSNFVTSRRRAEKKPGFSEWYRIQLWIRLNSRRISTISCQFC